MLRAPEYSKISLASVCRGVGIDHGFVAKKLPELSAQIVRQRKEYLRIKREAVAPVKKLQIQSAFYGLLYQGIVPTQNPIERALPKGLSLKDPSTRIEYKRLVQECREEIEAVRAAEAQNQNQHSLRPDKVANDERER